MSYCLLGVPTEVCVNVQFAVTEQTPNRQWNLQGSPSLLAPFLPSAFLIFRLRIQMVPGVFSPFFFYFSYTGIFVLLSFTLWACGCLSQPLVPVGAGRREVWEEILATTRQMTQGLSTVHRAMLLVEPNHVSEAGKGAISHQEICGGLGG